MSESAAPSAAPALDRWLRSAPLLGLAILVVYAPSLSGGWLGYDDDWLVRDNELLAGGHVDALSRVFFSFDRQTRLVLGAEYLPVRDLMVWFARGTLGLGPWGLRALLLSLYALACGGFLRWAGELALPITEQRGALLSVWLFAMHPVHAESVAWLAGIKDGLALLFTGWALFFYAQRDPRLRLGAIACIALGCLSKGAMVITPALLLLHDLWVRRRPDARVIVPALVVALALAGLHAWVGSVVGMFAEPLGDSRLEGVLAMAVVFCRYLGLSLFALPSSLFYEVDTHVPVLGSLALLFFGSLGALAALAGRRGLRWPAFALLVFLIGLAPVSQLLAPLQNRMADRYLFVAVLGPMVLIAVPLEWALTHVRAPLATFARVGVIAVAAALAVVRASIFTDPVALFEEGTERTSHNAIPPYMLAEAYLAEERPVEAEAAYRVAMTRDGLTTERGRRAGNNLARLLAREGRVPEALDLYRTLVERYPDDPRVLRNLAIIERRTGEPDAEEHETRLRERFPDYVPGRERPGPL